MQIIIKQSEIEVAVKNYIAGLGINLAGKDVEVSFTAGRKEDGLSASLDIVDTGASSVPVVPLKAVLEATAPIQAQTAAQQVSSKPIHVGRTPAAEPEPAPVQEVEEAVVESQLTTGRKEDGLSASLDTAVEAANDIEAPPAKKVNSLFG